MPAPKTCGNPDYYNIIETWYKEAKDRGSNYQYTLKKALDSLKNYPSKLTLSQLKSLPGIGPKTIAKLEKELNNTTEPNILIEPGEVETSQCSVNTAISDPSSSQRLNLGSSQLTTTPSITTTTTITAKRARQKKAKEPKPKEAKAYVPKFRSGGYAILIGLLKLTTRSNELHFPTKQIIEVSQPFTDHSLSQPGHNKHYAGFSSVGTLLKHELIYKIQQPTCYGLTELGRKLANQLIRANNELQLHNNNDVSFPELNFNFDDLRTNSQNSNLETRIETSPQFFDTTSELERGSFEIVLLVDNREVLKKNDRDYFSQKLSQLNVLHETRPLPIGDFLWVARGKDNQGVVEEIVLDYIIERKANSDLADSIKDGRYHEQKSRLQSCGCNKVIYLLEAIHYNDPIRFKLPTDTYWAALAQLTTQPKFSVKFTTNIDQTTQFLKAVTDKIVQKFQNRHLIAYHNPNLERFNTEASYQDNSNSSPDDEPFNNMYITYPTFKNYNKKSYTLQVQDIFKKMLVSTPYLTHKKCQLLVNKFPTPKHLIDALDNQVTKNEKLSLLVNGHPIPTLRIQPKLAESLVEAWSKL